MNQNLNKIKNINFISTLLFLTLILAGCETKNEIIFTSNNLEVGISKRGELTKLRAIVNNKDYIATEAVDNYILSIKTNGIITFPSSCNFDEIEKILTLKYLKETIIAEVKILEKEDYLTFELISITNKDAIEYIVWGPIKTNINETIGATIGIVRDADFAIGIQSLNKRTLGGYPTGYENIPAGNSPLTDDLVDAPDSLKIIYRGNTAFPQKYGSSLQANTVNRSKKRVMPAMGHEKYEVPKFEDGGIVGSKLAFFGCKPEEVLNTIEIIEIAEGLPHPLLDGEWAKKSVKASSSYLIQSFNSKNIDDAIALTKKAGLNYLYHPAAFETWGHFKLKEGDFPENWESMKKCVDKAEKQKIKLGIHTLANFITTNDPYVTPVPDKRLAKVGSALLNKNVDMLTQDIEIDDPTFFNQMKYNSLHAVVIGEEIIQYETVSTTEPWTLMNCQRGAFNTKVQSHKRGDVISKLSDHNYKTFLTNNELSFEMAERLADFCNTTGVKQISFDGLEGTASTGMGGEYGKTLFVDAWFNRLNPEIKDDYIMDASTAEHFFWHMFTRMNWGEPWYAGFRESHTKYRLLNQDYFRRNYMPCMLGWFSMTAMTSIEDIEWMLARSAAFDAGYALLTSPQIIQNNGYGDEILEKIKQWEKARMSGAFSKDQKLRMENVSNEFSLETLSENSWNLIPYSVERFEHKSRIRQPGEPVWSTFSFKNINERQSLQFILTTTNGVTVSNITFEIDDFKKVAFSMTLKPEQYLKYDGGEKVILYDKFWNKIKDIGVDTDKLVLGKGNHNIKVDCKFSDNSNKSGLKLEFRTAGTSEKVTIN